MRRPSAFEVRMMFGPTQVAASISTRVVPSETSEIWPPMIPAIPLGPSASQTSAISGSKRALDVVERGHRLALAGAPHDDPPAAHLVEVEGVERLAGGEHHVVGDVDDVRDRALAGGHQALLEPQRRRARSVTSSNTRAVKRRQISGSAISTAAWSSAQSDAGRLGVGRRWGPRPAARR